MADKSKGLTPFTDTDQTLDLAQSPDARTVKAFHRNSDVDGAPEAQHHTLGVRPDQAAYGNHSHNGINSKYLLEGVAITGSKASPSTVLPSIIQALTRLGATDKTT